MRILIFIFLLSLSLPSWSKNTEKYERLMNLDLKEKGAFYLDIPLALLEGTNTDDLRIFDKKGQEVPHFIEVSKSDSKLEEIPLKIFNKAKTKDGKTVLELDLQKSGIEEVNQIDLIAAEQNFSALVDVYGKDSASEDWKTLKNSSKILFQKFPDENVDFKQLKVQLPRTKFKFLKLVVSPETGKTEILSASVKNFTEDSSIQYNFIKHPFRELEKKSPDDKNTYWMINTEGFKYYPEKLIIKFPKKDFSRSANIYCSQNRDFQSLDDPSLEVLNSTILFKLDNQNNTEMTLSGKNCPYYLVSINQGDNLPIKPTNFIFAARKMYLKFLLEEPFEGPLRVYTKSKNPQKPNYDILERLKTKGEIIFQKVLSTEVLQNPSYKGPIKKSPKKELWKDKLPLLAALLIIIGAGAYVFKISKSNSPDRV
jgi:hypothetical protein